MRSTPFLAWRWFMRMACGAWFVTLQGCAHLDTNTVTESPAAPHMQRSLDDGLPVQLAPTKFTRPSPTNGPPRDLWERLRQGFALPALSGAAAERADLAAQNYARSALLMRSAQRAQLYLYPFVAEAERRGLPLELALLPYVESALNPHARSPAGAVGACQFMPATGKRFDLAQSAWVDQRRDVQRCANAMFDYLSENHERFGSWHLALAAYNWGEGAVARAIEKNRQAGLATTYENLTMPRETQNYVPALMGLAALVAQPERVGAALPPLDNLPPWVEVQLPADMDVHHVLQLAGIGRVEFERLNPGILRPVIPKAVQASIVLPPVAAERFVQALARQRAPTATWGAWRVPRTQTLAQIAKALNVSPVTLATTNDIDPKRLVLAGSVLAVPKRGAADIDEQLAAQGEVRTAAPVRAKGRKTQFAKHAVRKTSRTLRKLIPRTNESGFA